MGLTVKDIIQLPIMETAKVKTGKSVLHEIEVDWISVIETPVENFVRSNEFVLSTGIGCEDDPLLLEEFTRDVIQSGASVLAFATGRYIYDIPDRILQLAEQSDLILIDLPWEIRFGDILQVVLEEISFEKKAERQQAEEIRQELITFVLNGKGLQEISNYLYENTKIPIAISDHNKRIRANHDVDPHLLDVFNGKVDGQVQQIPQTDIQFSEHPLYHHIEEFVIDQQTCYQLTILSNQKKQGYLIFKPDDRHQLTWLVMNILEHALTACALYFLQENAIEMTEIRLKDNFLLELAKNENEITKQTLSKGQLLGYDLTKSYICMVGEISFTETNQKLKETDRSAGSSLHSRNYYIQKEINQAGELLNRSTMTTFEDGEVIVYLEADHHPYMEASNQFLDMVERRLNDLLAGIEISWGIAIHKDGHYSFHKSYQEAKTALDIGKQQYGKGERTFFSDTRINRLLMALSHDPDISSIVKDTLEKLIEYDKKRQTDLIHTFIVYNKYNSNVSQTARALNLHRQSLLHRLRNIEHLTGLSLVDSDDLFLLELSVRLWMLKKLE
ncbi:transcriptional regulator [Thalassobacillus devorans]|uniref:Transcriptional regulator n=1 Tax=Thalassobacillus devorans TaxID=279813 RepID=A0ABQ1PM99_9BACI|nr:PucR family transcriptional regulator [Thalassobacillus devorans]NIK30246.1 purine catabolism regulator [Thalassobacillus devorans]GGC99570.1 transcriptional regulator [Thalassobacillus devorans]